MVDENTAIEKAITTGFLSRIPKAGNYVNHWMFVMRDERGRDWFKHRDEHEVFIVTNENAEAVDSNVIPFPFNAWSISDEHDRDWFEHRDEHEVFIAANEDAAVDSNVIPFPFNAWSISDA